MNRDCVLCIIEITQGKHYDFDLWSLTKKDYVVTSDGALSSYIGFDINDLEILYDNITNDKKGYIRFKSYENCKRVMESELLPLMIFYNKNLLIFRDESTLAC